MQFQKSLSAIMISSIIFFVQTHSVQAEENSELRRSSVVVMSQPGFSFSRNQHFAWSDNHADISGQLKKSQFSVAELIDKAISQSLKAKGYSVVKPSDKSVLIQYHVSLESEMDDTVLAMTFGLSPGLQANSDIARKHEKGTLIVDLIDPVLKKVIWRGAIGVFTGVENTQSGRQQRVNTLLAELFNSIPTAD
jgi:uncharacterized protein DUF4136